MVRRNRREQLFRNGIPCVFVGRSGSAHSDMGQCVCIGFYVRLVGQLGAWAITQERPSAC